MHLLDVTLSAFYGKGKLKPLKVMLKNQKYINKFSEIRDDPEISNNQLEILQIFILQIFIYDVCGHKGDRVNLVKYKLYSSKQGKVEAKFIPPSFYSLQLHSRRAVYQSHIWRCIWLQSRKYEYPLEVGEKYMRMIRSASNGIT